MVKCFKRIIFLAGVIFLTSCGRADGEVEVLDAVSGAETAMEQSETSVSRKQESSSQETESHDGEGQAEESGEILFYAFETLATREERQLYEEILCSLTKQEKETELSTLNQELLEPVFHCVLADHPEIFYVDGYTSTTYKLGDELKKITFSGDYTMDETEIIRRSSLLEEVIDEWLSGLEADVDDYEKVKYLYDTLILHTEYELGCADSQNICSVFLNGRSVCQGYAKSLQLLCQRAGIPALLVTGRVNGDGHAWDMLQLDGEWYYVDPTWGDASYQQEEGETLSESAYPAINYDYFCVTTEQILRTHEAGEEQNLPVCTAVTAQYYRHEGLYLESVDTEKLAGIFQRAIEEKAETVTFQCADDEVYQEIYRLLIGQQKIFDYLPGTDGTIAYADSLRQRTFCFWLA